VRLAAREQVSRLFERHVEPHSEKTRVAAILWVSEKAVRAWADAENAHANIDVADIVAVYLAGGKVLALGFARDLVRLLEAHEGRKGWPRADHAMSLSAAAGSVSAHARSGSADEYRDALHVLDRRVQDALRDADGGER